MSSSEAIIEVRNLAKRYEVYDQPRDRLKQLIVPKLVRLLGRDGDNRRYYREFWALRKISFDVRRGETLGIVGRNGSGKSTLLQIIAGTLAPTLGDVTTKGRVAALLELGSGFNPDFSGRENVLLNARILGLSHKQIAARYDEIVSFADIGDFIEQPVKTYSSGMFVRLAFAVQAHLDASIVIIDEALAVGDVFFRQKCYARLEQIRKSGAAVLLVSHALTDIEQFCDRAIILDNGQISFAGDAIEATKRYYQMNQSVCSHAHLPRSAHDPDPVQGQSGATEINSITNPLSERVFDKAEFCDAGKVTQVGNGWAECTRFAVLDEHGNPCCHFWQGQTAIFISEFRILRDMGSPTCGVVLHSERGIIVHGKGSIEHGVSTDSPTRAGAVVRCVQAIDLNLQVGEYSFEIGLGSIEPDVFRRLAELSHEEIDANVRHICVLPKAGSISIGWQRVRAGSALTHHGIADLPGSIELNVSSTG